MDAAGIVDAGRLQCQRAVLRFDAAAIVQQGRIDLHCPAFNAAGIVQLCGRDGCRTRAHTLFILQPGGADVQLPL